MEPTSHGKATERTAKRSGKRRSLKGEDSALIQLRKRLKMLREYHADTLVHRAGDVELAVETVIFDQLMRRSKSASENNSPNSDALQGVLQNVQVAVQELADQRQNNRQDYERLMEQFQRLTDLTESLTRRAGETSQATSTPEQSAVPTVELEKYASVVAQLENLRREHDDLINYVERLKTDAENSSVATSQDTAEYSLLQKQVQELTEELAKAREESVLQEFVKLGGTSGTITDSRDCTIQTLREQLLQERQTVVELRLEIDELNAKLREGKQSGSTTGLSWDEQKVLLLQKLEGRLVKSLMILANRWKFAA